MNRRVHVFVSGRVQGVFFRSSTKDQAQRLGLTGFVRNCPDGRVEILAEGPSEAIEDLIEWCRVGPPGARVESVHAGDERCLNEFDAFTVQAF
jgi:acylphosphatase